MQRSTSLDATARRHSLGGTGTCVHVPAAAQTAALHGSRSSLHDWPAGAGVPGTHAPSAQTSPTVHALPSSHAVPAGSARQRAEQQSPSAWLPSSQFSKGSITPFPHLVADRGTLQALLLDVHVICVSSPSPVPLQARSAQSQGISPAAGHGTVPGSQ